MVFQAPETAAPISARLMGMSMCSLRVRRPAIAPAKKVRAGHSIDTAVSARLIQRKNDAIAGSASAAPA